MTTPLNHAHWKIHGANDLLPYTLLLESDGAFESTGVTTSQLSASRGSLAPSLLRDLNGSGIALDATELAVLSRLQPLIGHGAFAAAHVHLVPPYSQITPLWPTVHMDASAIAAGDACAGMVADGVCGAPYIALARGDELTDCLLLTWHGDWVAFRTYLRTDFLRPGASEFHDALHSHKERVITLLGPPGVLAAMKSRTCVN